MDLFKLVGSVFIDTDQANDSLQKTDEKAQKTGTSFKDIAGKAAKVGTAVVGASAAAVGGIVSLANNAASAADEIDKGSIRMGISTDYYQQLGYAAGQSGVEMGTLEKAAKKLEGTDLNLEDAMNQIMSLETAEDRAAKAAELTPAQLTEWVVAEIERSGLLKVIYFQAVDALTMQEVSTWDESPRIQGYVAVQAGAIRLIDNVKIK